MQATSPVGPSRGGVLVALSGSPRETPPMTPTPNLGALASDALAATGGEACPVLDALTWLGRAGGR